MGTWEEGIAGTIIKDTWTTSGGRVEVEEGGEFSWGGVEDWGEKAYNCNSITIKIKKKLLSSINLQTTRAGKNVEKWEFLCTVHGYTGL